MKGKCILEIAFIILIGAGFFEIMRLIEPYFQYYYRGEGLDEWIDTFHFWGSTGIFISTIASLIWYILGQWCWRIDNKEDADKRVTWAFLIIFPVLAFIIAELFTPNAGLASFIAFAFYSLGNILIYYLTTAFFSPSAFKYTPWGASKIRKFR